MGTSIWDVFDECMKDVYSKKVSEYDGEEYDDYDFDKFVENLTEHHRHDMVKSICHHILGKIAEREEQHIHDVVRDMLCGYDEEEVCIIQHGYNNIHISGEIPEGTRLVINNKSDLRKDEEL